LTPETLAAVRAEISAACARAKRSVESVTLVAVSKKQPNEKIEAAYALGVRDFGENYAQELRDKAAALQLGGIRWHAIGPVQPKNAKYIAKAAHTFHALESEEVAVELSKRREGAPLRVLIEVNVAGEASKAGVAPSDVPALLERVRALPKLEVVGLTAMPPLVDDAELNRPHFKALAALAKQLGLGELSMGSTADYAVAIEEGATLVRVGTALFGDRPPRT
jgi:PLP dependent protein